MTLDSLTLDKLQTKIKVLPKKHVFFLKTHKTGSTTLYSILAEFCRNQHLFPLMPRGAHINIFYPRLQTRMLELFPGVAKYDMVFNHQIFDPAIYDYLHNDTFTFTIIRKPRENFISSFNYWSQIGGWQYLVGIPGPDKLFSYFLNPRKYEPDNVFMSFTNNRQSVDLGFDVRNHRFNDTEYIKTFIRRLDRYFDLVLIFEYYNESLVMLKRWLGWTTKDILYFKKLKFTNLAESQKRTTTMTEGQERLFDAVTPADNALYDHFLSVFKEKMSKEKHLKEEVEEFRQVLHKVTVFCGSADHVQLNIPAGRWTDQVSILRPNCHFLLLDEQNFTQFLKTNNRKYLKTTKRTKRSSLEVF